MGHDDTSDITQKAYLSSVLVRMKDQEEDTRIRALAMDLLVRKIERGLISPDHANRWRELLAMSTEDLSEILLQDNPDGREMRHAHLLAGAIPAREANKIRKASLEGLTGTDPDRGETLRPAS